MPFGKYKGIEVKNLPKDYISWLSGIELNGPLKKYVNEVVESKSYQEYLDHSNNLEVQAEEERMESEKLERDYINDIKFWGRVSPNSVIDTIRKNDIEIEIDTWKWLLKNSEKTSF